MTAPVVLVLDDVHLLHNSECRSALSVLADHVPGGSRLAFAGRSEPPVRVARLRAEDRILEVGPGDLSLNRGEAASLLRAARVVLGADEVAELHQRTEGWPVGLYLAALSLREGGSLDSAAISFGGDDRFVSDYMESELLARISPRRREFLTQTAVLERMSGPLCEAVLEVPGSAATLADLARSNLLLVPLDRRGQWYRYHHLFRDMLLAELERLERGLVPVLRRRAASWCLHNDLPEAALEYSIAAGDVDEAADLVGKLWLPTYRQGRVTTVQRWIGWLDDRGGIEGHPMAAVWAALLAVILGRPVEAERWADALDRWQYGNTGRPDDPATEAWAAVVRALLCRCGAERMRADADEAARGFAATGIVAPVAALMQGIARILCGDPEGGDAFFEDVVGFRELAAPDTLSNALGERSLLAMARGDWSQAEALASQASSVVRRSEFERPLYRAVQARVALHRGDLRAVRQELVSAQRLRPLVTYAQPHLAVQIRIELIRVHLALSDLAGARTLMREIDDVLKRRPGLGTLAGEAEALRDRLARERRSSIAGSSALTAAELRILPMLATHLSFPEIGKELFLSRHTIKSAMKSIYRKLGATTRNEAVIRARELGLLEG
jgi:LuxR family transcriptional regulator, maltose regulon positive regulatory protein